MPERENTQKRMGGGKPAWKRSDKCVQAEVKNKIEIARLNMQKRFLDRQCSSNQWFIEKEKRQAVTALRRMNNTSGVSSEGQAPDGPGDRKHEKSPYFTSNLGLSEKRLVRWRAAEKELERELMVEQLDKPPWERGQDEEAKEGFGKMMRLMGYDIDDDALEKAEKRKKTSGRPTSAKSFMSNKSQEDLTDVFECLKLDDDSGEENKTLSNGLTKGKSEESKEQQFSAKSWGRSYTEDYVSSVSAPVKIGPVTRNMRNQSASALLKSYKSVTNLNSGRSTPTPGPVKPPRNAWGDTSGDKNMEVKGKPTNNNGKIKIRPASAAVCRQHDVGTPPRAMRGMARPQSNLGPRQPRSSIRPQSADARVGKPAAVSIYLQIPHVGNSDGPPISVSNMSSDILEDNSKGISFSSDNNSDLHIDTDLGGSRDSVFMDGEFGEANGQGGKLGQVSTAVQRRSSKVSFANDVAMQSITKAPVKKRRHTLANLAINRKIPRRKSQAVIEQVTTPQPTTREKKHRRDSAPVGVSLIKEDNQDEDPDGDYDKVIYEGNSRSIPRWKRDLMMEAPPGLNSNKEPIKVSLVMSKKQRQRELDKLVDDNRADARTIVNYERSRRMSSRLNIYMTMSKLEEAAMVTGGAGTVGGDPTTT